MSEWAFKSSHVPDPTVNTDRVLSAGRSVIYVAKAAVAVGASMSSDSFRPVGVIQSYSFGENRQIDQVFELGSEIPYLVPGRASGSIQITRLMMHGKDLANTLYGTGTSNVITSLKDIKVPLNIMFVAFGDETSAMGTSDANSKMFSRLFINCWLTSRSESIGAGQTILGENCSMLYQDISKVTITVKANKTGVGVGTPTSL